ncbi:MAG: ACP S-malonyltransferase [Lachnospiraceae bacterium]|nr:ACP S-malonyltransferase [Lachnospiraceae bacterium]
MSKIMYMFPGQGAQYIGMGKAMYDEFDKAREIFDKASAVTGLDIPALCFEENDRINITEYTQIAMLATEAAIYAVMEEKGLKCDYTAGLSLGEYGALIAAGVLSYEDAFKVVRKRGIFMQEAVPTGGAMAAVLGMDAETIEKICSQAEGYAAIANYNCPGQIVITGEQAAVEKASEALKEAGAKRVVPLNVSGPFHSKMLVPAGEKLGAVIDEVTIGDVRVPYVSNVTAQLVTDSVNIKDLLVKQISSSVRWQQTIELMLDEGVDTFVEIGPGKTLTGFMRKINKEGKEIQVYHIENPEELKAYVER